MTEQEWQVDIIEGCIFRNTDCGLKFMSPTEIEARLNEHAALKRENEGLLGIVGAYHPEYLRGCDCPQCSDATLLTKETE